MTKQESRQLAAGTKVFCTVRGEDYGWHTVASIRPRDGYIKLTDGWNVWCPPYNFSLTDSAGRTWGDWS